MRHYTWRMLLVSAALLTIPPVRAEELAPPTGAPQCVGSGINRQIQLVPIASSRKLAPYPVISQRLGEQGVAYLRVLVDKDGNAAEVTILRSSGWARLDEASIDGVKGVWRWEPPPPQCRESGVAVMVSYDWSLGPRHYRVMLDNPHYPSAARDRKLGGTGLISVSLSAEGKITEIKIQKSTGSAELDDGMKEIAGSLQYFPQKRNNIPVSSTIDIPVDFIPESNPISP